MPKVGPQAGLTIELDEEQEEEALTEEMASESTLVNGEEKATDTNEATEDQTGVKEDVISPEVVNAVIEQTKFATETRENIQKLAQVIEQVNAQLASTSEQIAQISELASLFTNVLQENGGNGQVASPPAAGEPAPSPPPGGALSNIMQNALPFLQVLAQMGSQPQSAPAGERELVNAMSLMSNVFQVFTAMQSQNTKAAVENLKLLKSLSQEITPPPTRRGLEPQEPEEEAPPRPLSRRGYRHIE